jgi:hypothetical protein
MAEHSVVSAVCQIPLEYRQPEGLSLQHYVEESGYFAKPEELSVAAVVSLLRQNPELVDQWFFFSEDKRTSDGWYVMDDGDRAVVGQIGGPKIVFSDRAEACAEFIVREIREVAPPHRGH